MQHALWSYDAVIYEMNVRQLTEEGTFAAAMRHLQHLSEMGVDAIWLMPVYPIGKVERKGSLGSYYSISDYCDINPEFGTMADFDAFVEEAHRLDMKVLLDWVANHTARDAKWLKEKPMNWYERDENGVAKVPWDWSDTAKLNYAEREVWQGQIDAMKFWVRKHNIDGFRCDMAMLVPTAFWQEVRKELQSVKKNIFLLAEAEGEEFFDEAFDACYGWELHHAMVDVAQGKSRVWELRNKIYNLLNNYPQSSMHLSFTSNHDENSWSGSEHSRFGDSLEAMTALSFVLPKSLPLIYTGQEYGYDHSFAFFDKDAMPAMEKNETTELYRRLCDMKHLFTALRSADLGGSFVEIDNNAPDCLLTFVRENQQGRVVYIANLSPYKVFSDFHTGIYAGDYTDVVAGVTSHLYEHTWGDMEPWSYRLLVQKF
ncbi:MAG: alpha amylase C-terminal domain-containing protein [Alistipes sp.]|nr:alpha amylase C-terminal domain-containing protein [Alistipes sp.]MBP3550394.1 alpha amylase C-terminal domain-containing protein [Alistipes sp.]